MTRRVSLETWLTLTYGDDAPALATARRWCREKKIYPHPEKHGRSYFLDPEARYNVRPRLVDRLRAETASPG